MMTLQQHLDEHLPYQRQPNHEWVTSIAHKCRMSPAAVWAAVRAWKRPAAGPVVRVPACPATVAHPIPERGRPRGFDAVVDALRRLGHELKANRNGFMTRCPLHRDRRPSLQISRGHDDRTALVFCHSCGRTKTKQILSAVGLTLADCFPDDLTAHRSRRREILAEYPYVTMASELVAVKVRYRDTFSAKRFGWRIGDRWRLTDDEKARIPLYREHDAIASSLIYIVEGEKAADRLWQACLPAVCAPHGAGTWEPRWTESVRLLGVQQVVILPDHDAAGRAHGEIVATALHAAEIAVQVVALPALAHGQDVYDWLADGHAIEELEAVVAETPMWTPGATERQRVEQQRTKWREKKQRQRKNRRDGVPPRMSEALVPLRMSVGTRVPSRMSGEPAAAGDVPLSPCPPCERTSGQRSKGAGTETISVHLVHQSSTEEIPTDGSNYPDLSLERSLDGWRR